MIIHDMRTTLPDKLELDVAQNTRMNAYIMDQRSAAKSRIVKKPKYWLREWVYHGYIIIDDRFFIYNVKIKIDSGSYMEILSEKTTEVGLDEWLDLYGNYSQDLNINWKDKYPRHPLL